jgi:hypothetical protein
MLKHLDRPVVRNLRLPARSFSEGLGAFITMI